MSSLNTLSEKGFVQLLSYPKRVLALIILLSALIMMQVSSIEFDGSSEKLLDKSNTAFQTYLNFKEDYQAGLSIILLIEDEHIFSTPFLQRLKLLQEEILTTVPYIDNVESLLNSRRIIGDADELYFDTLIPEKFNKNNIKQAKSVALNTPYYLNHIINPEGNTTALIIKMQPFIYDANKSEARQILQKEMSEIINSIHQVINSHQANFSAPIHIGGPSTATIEMVNATKHDVTLFSLLALAIIAAALAMIFRRLSAITFPLILLILAISATLSCMLIAEVPIQNVSAILPSFLLAVCVCDSVHFLQVFYKSYDAGETKYEAILFACNHTKVALFFTSITTSGGLLSFAGSALTPIANFGFFAALGVIIALLFTYLCLPALLLICPIKQKNRMEKGRPQTNKFTTQLTTFIQKNAKAIVYCAIALFIISIYFTSQLKLSHDTLSWFPENNKARQAVEQIDKKLTGTMSLELLIDSGSDSGIYDPTFLHTVDDWLKELDSTDTGNVEIRTSSSLLNLIKEVHAILSDEKQYALPNSRELIAQEILLIEVDAEEQVSVLTDANYRTLRISIATSWQDAIYYQQFMQTIESSFNNTFEAPITLTMTGMIALGSQILTEMMQAMISSYLIAAGIVSGLMILLLRSLKLGAIMMLPNLMPITLILAFMTLTNIPLDMFTLLIGAIAIGIIVDDSIHFIYGFKRNYTASGSTFDAINKTFESEGIALLITTLILSTGFLIYLFSSLNNLHSFGLLTALCIVLAFIADIILAPAILFIVYPEQTSQN